MKKPFTDPSEPLPEGLTNIHCDGVRWWTRNKQPRGKSIYAVCIQYHRKKAAVSALKVIGFLDSKTGKWSRGTREKAMKWVVRDESDPKVFRTVHSYAKLSHMNLSCDAHWFGVRASSPEEAKSHPDVMFVLSHLAHYHVTDAFRGVYFISNSKGAVKIGQTTSSLVTRLTALQIGSPDPLRIVAAIDTEDSLKIERRIHSQHASLLIRGEWFAMTDEMALQIAISNGGRRWCAGEMTADEALEAIA